MESGAFFYDTGLPAPGQNEEDMVIVMSPDATSEDIAHVATLVESVGNTPVVSRGVSRTIIGVIGDDDRTETLNLRAVQGVLDVVRITAPYKLVSRENHARTSTVWVSGVPIGPDTFTLIAGPCAVETPEQTLAAAQLARSAGAAILRGGAFKPRTSPYSFQGLGVDGLKILREVGDEVGMPVVTEVVDRADVDAVATHADMLQIGTRNAQNFELLKAVGDAGKPVLLKRGLAGTYDEWLLAAEYIAQRGNLDIVLCERGIRTFESQTRNTLDLSAVPMMNELSHLPVVVDPSHAAGRRELVVPLARAAIAVGADAVMVDVHAEPETALVDGAQALSGEVIDELADAVRTLPGMMGRRSARRG